MASKYDSYWIAQARALSRLITAAASGARADLDVSALHALGDRQSLYGVARVRGRTVLAASNAHAVSLGNVVTQLGLSEDYPTQVISFLIDRAGRLRVEILGQPTTSALTSRQTATVPWDLKSGDVMRRTELHRRYGGRRQGGIGPSAVTPNVFLFTDPRSGAAHGYTDGWQSDGCFHYTGEGQRGDQEMHQGNLAILDAKSESRAIRLFRGSGGEVEYVDEFVLDAELPYYTTDAPESGGGPIRSVIVFRLQPTTVKPPHIQPTVQLPAKALVDLVPVEANNVERMYVEPSREEYEAERRESALVQTLKDCLEREGHVVQRLRIQPPGEAKPMFCDVYVQDLDLLVEAKGSVDRQSIRMAIGQLIDYRRFKNKTTRCALLLPSRPRTDLLALINAAGFELICVRGDSVEWPSHGERARIGGRDQ